MRSSLISSLEKRLASSDRKDLVVLDTLSGLRQERSHGDLLKADFDNPLFTQATGKVLQSETWNQPWEPRTYAWARSRYQKEGQHYVAKLVWGSELSRGSLHIVRAWEEAMQRSLIPLCMSHVLRLLTLRQLPEEMECVIPLGESLQPEMPITSSDIVPAMGWDAQFLVVRETNCNEYFGKHCLFAEEVEF